MTSRSSPKLPNRNDAVKLRQTRGDDPAVSVKDLLRRPGLPGSFYRRATERVAADLLGAFVVRRFDGEVRVGRIVETEAYLGEHDLACHSARGRTARTEPMFGPPGRAYVYMIYGMYHCLNVVTEPPGHAAAVLVRALEPVAGLTDRTDGPGRLCRALAIDRSFNGVDLSGTALRICILPGRPRPRCARRTRIGVDYAGSWARRRLRFVVPGHPCLSVP